MILGAIVCNSHAKRSVCAIRKTEEAIRIAQEGIRKEAARKGRKVQPQTLESPGT